MRDGGSRGTLQAMRARRLARATGQTTAEYLGALVIVAVIGLTLVRSDVPERISCGIEGAIARIAGDSAPGCGGFSTDGGDAEFARHPFGQARGFVPADVDAQAGCEGAAQGGS